jgi:HNH endonuclease
MKESWPDWEVYKRDLCTCVYCAFSGLNNLHAWRQLAIDHLVPRARGGGESGENKVVSCHRCNELKGCFDPSGGARPTSISAEMRKDFIEKVKHYLDIEGSEERRDFDRMMSET